MLLKRLGSMGTLQEHVMFFNRSESELSLIYREMIDLIYNQWHHLLSGMHRNLASDARLNEMATAVSDFLRRVC